MAKWNLWLIPLPLSADCFSGVTFLVPTPQPPHPSLSSLPLPPAPPRLIYATWWTRGWGKQAKVTRLIEARTHCPEGQRLEYLEGSQASLLNAIHWKSRALWAFLIFSKICLFLPVNSLKTFTFLYVLGTYEKDWGRQRTMTGGLYSKCPRSHAQASKDNESHAMCLLRDMEWRWFSARWKNTLPCLGQ